jgi:NAD-dependent SIR2 family protein deacetylase
MVMTSIAELNKKVLEWRMKASPHVWKSTSDPNVLVCEIHGETARLFYCKDCQTMTPHVWVKAEQHGARVHDCWKCDYCWEEKKVIVGHRLYPEHVR